MVAALSPSRASDFKHCPLLYRFRAVDRLPSVPSLAAARGTLVHAVLERLFDLPAHERTPEAAAALVAPTWERLRAEEPELAHLGHEAGATHAVEGGSVGDGSVGDGSVGDESVGDESVEHGWVEQEWLEQAGELLDRWFTLEDPTRLEPAERELYVETEIDGLVLRGYVDRLDVAPDGSVRIVDYKTGRSPSERGERASLFQLRFYALVLWRLRGQVPRMLQLVYLGDGEVIRYQPDEAALLATERGLKALWSAISEAAAAGDWRPRRSRACQWCEFRALCPEWGGTPPPLPVDAERRALDVAVVGHVRPADD